MTIYHPVKKGDPFFIDRTVAKEFTKVIRNNAQAPTIEDVALYSSAGAINVKAYGAEGNGTADDTAAIQEAWNALASANDAIYFPVGTYQISDTLVLEDKIFTHIYGERAVIKPDPSVDWTGKALVSFAGSSYYNIEGIRMEFSGLANPPAIGIATGRTATGHGGGGYMAKCSLKGQFTHSALYNVGIEGPTYINLNLSNTEDGGCAYFDSSEDDASLGFLSNVSNVEKQFYGCFFRHSVDDNSAVVLKGLVKEISFRDCYFVTAGGSSYGIDLRDGASEESTWSLVIDQCRMETTETVDETGIRFLNVNNTGYLWYLSIRNLNYTVSSDVIQVNTNLLDSTIDIVQYDTSYNLISIANGATMQRCEINCMYDEAIDVDAGGIAATNLLKGVNDYDTPFVGSGSYGAGRKNTIISTSFTKFVKRKQDQQGFADGDTTPSVATGDYFYIANTNATSITDLDDPVIGQEVVLYFVDANTTIVHSSSIRLAGSANYNPPGSSTLTLFRTDGYGWVEKARSDAT